MIEKGEDPSVMMAQLRKGYEAIGQMIKAAEEGARTEVEQCLAGTNDMFVDRYGVELSLSSTGDRLDYDQDIVYADLKRKMKDRENLLKLAFKRRPDDTVDDEGAKVPIVKVKTNSRTVLKARIR